MKKFIISSTCCLLFALPIEAKANLDDLFKICETALEGISYIDQVLECINHINLSSKSIDDSSNTQEPSTSYQRLKQTSPQIQATLKLQRTDFVLILSKAYGLFTLSPRELGEGRTEFSTRTQTLASEHKLEKSTIGDFSDSYLRQLSPKWIMIETLSQTPVEARDLKCTEECDKERRESILNSMEPFIYQPLSHPIKAPKIRSRSLIDDTRRRLKLLPEEEKVETLKGSQTVRPQKGKSLKENHAKRATIDFRDAQKVAGNNQNGHSDKPDGNENLTAKKPNADERDIQHLYIPVTPSGNAKKVPPLPPPRKDLDD